MDVPEFVGANGLLEAAQRPGVDLEGMDRSGIPDVARRKHGVIANVRTDVDENRSGSQGWRKRSINRLIELTGDEYAAPEGGSQVHIEIQSLNVGADRPRPSAGEMTGKISERL